MGFADVWNRTLVYFGIAEEDDWDEDGYATNEELQRTYGARERANVRRLQPRRGRDFDDWTDPEPEAGSTAVMRPATRLRGVEAVLPAAARARRRARAGRALDGHVPGLPRRGRGGRDADPPRIRPLWAIISC